MESVFAKVKGRGGRSAILVLLLVTVFAFAFVFVNVFFFYSKSASAEEGWAQQPPRQPSTAAVLQCNSCEMVFVYLD